MSCNKCERHPLGKCSEAFGCKTCVTGKCSMANGRLIKVTGDASFGSGKCNLVSGDTSIGSGTCNQVSGDSALVAGTKNNVSGDSTAVVGNLNQVSGSNGIVGGQQHQVSGSNGIVGGQQHQVSGSNNLVSGDQCVVGGNNCQALGFRSRAVGYQNHAHGALAFSFGAQGSASGFNISTGEGRVGVKVHGHDAKAYRREEAPGQYNYLLDPDNYSIQLGGGVYGNNQDFNPLNPSTPHGMGISVTLRTKTMGVCPIGEVVSAQHRSDFTGYADLYRLSTPSPQPFGLFYALDTTPGLEHQVVQAINDDDVIGVASDCAAFVGDAGDLPASQGWIRDDLLCPSFQDETTKETIRLAIHNVPSDIQTQAQVIFQEYCDCLEAGTPNQTCLDQFLAQLAMLETSDPGQLQLVIDAINGTRLEVLQCSSLEGFIPRSVDPSWIPIVYLGKVAVNDNGSATPGSLVSVQNGIAVPGSKFRVLKRITPTTIQILMK